MYHVLAHHAIPGFTSAEDGITRGTTAPAPPVSTGLDATYLASFR